MTSLEIEQAWLAVLAEIEEAGGEITDEVAAKLDALSPATADKLDANGFVMDSLGGKVKTIKETILRFQGKLCAAERALEWVKGRTQAILAATGQKRVSTASGWSIWVQANGGKVPVEVEAGTDAANVEAGFPALVRTEKRIDVDATRAALEAGVQIPWARLGERGSHLRFK